MTEYCKCDICGREALLCFDRVLCRCMLDDDEEEEELAEPSGDPLQTLRKKDRKL